MKQYNLKASEPKNRDKKKILLTIICVFLGLVLTFGITLGIIIGVKNAKAVFSLDGVTLDEGETSYFATYYKYRFITEHASEGAYDSADFWNKTYKAHETYGELLEKETAEYIKSVLVSAYLFDTYSSLTVEDEERIDKAVAEVLDYKADGSEERFNELSLPCGFDFESFKSAAKIYYKACEAFSRIYGEQGENIKSFSGECAKYFENYSHVKLLFIRTEERFLLDENGNRIPDENGNDTLAALTDKEKAERQQLLATIRASISAYNEDSNDPQMSPDYFDRLLVQHDEGDVTKYNSGYYFSPYSSYSKEFAGAYPEIVKKALEMDKDSYAELSYDGGVCFIYKYKNTDGAYADTSEGGFFEDFYYLAASSLFSEAVESLTSEVKVSEKYEGIDLFLLEYNYVLIPRF